jgi:hypothetical protein
MANSGDNNRMIFFGMVWHIRTVGMGKLEETRSGHEGTASEVCRTDGGKGGGHAKDRQAIAYE